jgi:hypothetical protein
MQKKVATKENNTGYGHQLMSIYRYILAAMLICYMLCDISSANAERLQIDSAPRGARLFLNGEERGLTPVTLRLDAGRYHLELRRSGYLTWASYIQLPQRTQMSLQVSLEKPSRKVDRSDRQRPEVTREPREQDNGQDEDQSELRFKTPEQTQAGVLIANSKPAEAEVYLGKRLLGRTPLLVYLPFGGHTLVFRLKGYAPLSQKIEIKKTRSTRINVKLVASGTQTKPQQDEPLDISSDDTSTQLMITSKPIAQVFLNDRDLGSTPVLTAGLQPGTYSLVLKRKGYITYRRSIQLQSGQKLRLNILLSPQTK